MISNAHHSAQSITVEGIDNFRYAPHPLNDSSDGSKMHSRILYIKHVIAVITTNIEKYVTVVAYPSPSTPNSSSIRK